MRRILAFLLLPILVCVLAAQEKADPGDAILRRFVSEFITLTPGKGKYPAEFVMGTPGQNAPASEKPPVTVRFKTPFALCKYEVTQELYQLVMGENPSRWKGPRNSVEMIDHAQAQTFCTSVTELLRKKKLLGENEVIRLPSEAEWEYACRAGTTTAYSFGDDVSELGAYSWYKANSPGNDPPVGKKKPNAWGFYDMHGYVSEWCADVWSADHKGAATDGSPRKDDREQDRVIRGGSFADPPEIHRSAARGRVPAGTRSDRIGFRCVRAAAMP